MNILLAEDQSMLRDALAKLLLLEDAVTTVYQAENGQVAIDMLRNKEIDVAILDIEMPIKTGLDVLEFSKENFPEIKVIIVTTFRRSGYFERAVKNDVDAYVLKERSTEELMRTINNVFDGKKEYSPELMENIFSTKKVLTEQELKILSLVEKGYANKDIADKLYLSNGTVRNYISNILTKLAVDNRSAAVYIAKENGWLD